MTGPAPQSWFTETDADRQEIARERALIDAEEAPSPERASEKDHARDLEPEKLHPRDVPWCQEHRRAMVRGPRGAGWYCPTVMPAPGRDST